MYTLATKPLIRKLRSDIPNVRQVWYADDATGADTSGSSGVVYRYMAITMATTQMLPRHIL